MSKALVYREQTSQGDRPEWGPLLDAVREHVVAEFMWMFEVKLADGPPIQAYKHRLTRRYVHLAPDGTAFVFEPPDRYRRVPTAPLLVAAITHIDVYDEVYADEHRDR